MNKHSELANSCREAKEGGVVHAAPTETLNKMEESIKKNEPANGAGMSGGAGQDKGQKCEVWKRIGKPDGNE
jgi:hypothetical protein